MKKIVSCSVVFLMAFSGTLLLAQSNVDDRIQKLENELQQLKEQQGKSSAYQEQVKQLLAETQKPAEPTLAAGLMSLTKYNVDFRYRYRMNDDDKNINKNHQNWLRGRIAISGKANDEMDLVMRVAGDGVMQERDTAGSDFRGTMDLIYLDYHPGSVEKIPFLGIGVDFLDNVNPFYNLDGLRGIHFLAGKFENPFYHPGNSNIAFGTPFAPQGIAGIVNKNVTDDLNLFSSAAGLWVDERSSTDTLEDSQDTSLWGLQLGGTYKLTGISEKSYVTAGAGYYDWGNIEGKTAGWSNNPKTGGLINSDYNLINGFAEFGLPVVKEMPIVGDIPIKFFGEYFQNLQADSDNDSAYLVGLGFAEIAKLSNIRFFYNYMNVGREATVDGFSDSNFGAPTVEGRGHRFSVGYKVMKNCVFDVDYYTGNRDTTVAGTSTANVDFQRVDASLTVKF